LRKRLRARAAGMVSFPMTDGPLRIAFTGTGYISRIHAAAARALGADLSAVVNHRPESMAAFAETFGISRQFASVPELLQDGGVDALVVSTPNALHAAETVAALEAGVPVMVEKPMAVNAAEAEAMQAASARSGAPLMVAHCWRFDPEVLWLQARVAAGQLGRLIRTKGYGVHVNWGPGRWFTEHRLAGGGAMADMGIHAIDTARFLLGDPEPVSVYARLGTYYKDFDVDDTGVVIVNWENGAVSYIESGWWQPYSDGPEASTQLYGTAGFGQVFPTRVQLADGQAQDAGFVHPRPKHCPQSLYDTQMAYFFECVRSGSTPIPGGREGCWNVRVVDAAYESARTGQVVTL
jgi:predicted dehydrogenase